MDSKGLDGLDQRGSRRARPTGVSTSSTNGGLDGLDQRGSRRARPTGVSTGSTNGGLDQRGSRPSATRQSDVRAHLLVGGVLGQLFGVVVLVEEVADARVDVAVEG